jgi:hypothetical protein
VWDTVGDVNVLLSLLMLHVLCIVNEITDFDDISGDGAAFFEATLAFR